jgi:hypothetical protein
MVFMPEKDQRDGLSEAFGDLASLGVVESDCRIAAAGSTLISAGFARLIALRRAPVVGQGIAGEAPGSAGTVEPRGLTRAQQLQG